MSKMGPYLMYQKETHVSFKRGIETKTHHADTTRINTKTNLNRTKSQVIRRTQTLKYRNLSKVRNKKVYKKSRGKKEDRKTLK